MTEQHFRFLVLLTAQLYTSVELMDDALSKVMVKGSTKRKLRMAMQSLEADIKPFVHKLYENEEELIFQNIQEELQDLVEKIVSAKLEDIANKKLSNDT